jgi:FKBP-type peptidyl-prolyl cis-trans isomerase FklB
MKKLLPAIALLITVHALGQKPPVKSPVAPAIKLNGRADSIQYTIGAFMGLWITNNGLSLSSASPLFLRGLDDVLLNRSRTIPDSLITSNLNGYAETALKGKAAQEEQRLFSSLKDKPGMGMFPNGVRYLVMKAGTGPRPLRTDSITVHMIAKLPNGNIVEDTYQVQKPFETKTTAFFPALNEILEMMTEGSKWEIYFPAALAYGETGTAMIPPNTPLVVEVELVKVRSFK